MKGDGCWSLCQFCHGIHVLTLKKITKNINQDIQWSGRGSKWTPFTYSNVVMCLFHVEWCGFIVRPQQLLESLLDSL